MALLMKWCSYISLLTHPPSCPCLGMLGCLYWCGYPRFLEILIALKSKDVYVILSMIFNQSLSEVWLRSLVFYLGTPFSVKELGSYLSSQDTSAALKSKLPLRTKWYIGGSWYSRCLSRSIAMFSHDRVVKFMSKLVLWIALFSKNLYWIPWTSWLSLNNNLESWKTRALSRHSSFSKGCLVCSCRRKVVLPWWKC